MKKPFIKYRGGYKYQLAEEYSVQVGIFPENDITTNFIDLNSNGALVIKKWYAWDGPSGPTIDTLNFMRGSLVHDALYQLMRNESLDREEYRIVADRELKRICIEDGMWQIRAWWVYNAVCLFAKKATLKEKITPVTTAP